MSPIFVLILISVSFTCSLDASDVEDPLFTSLHSSASKCLNGGKPSPNMAKSLYGFNQFKEECLNLLNIKNEEEEPFCYKYCMLNQFDIITELVTFQVIYNETFHTMGVQPELTATQLLLFYHGEFQEDDDPELSSGEMDASYLKTVARLPDGFVEKFEKCSEMTAWFLEIERCHHVGSAEREKVMDLINCVETAMQC